MHRGQKCTGSIELLDAGPGDAQKSMSPGLGRGMNAFFCIVSYWQGVKIHEYLLKLHSSQCIGASCVLAAMSL